MDEHTTQHTALPMSTGGVRRRRVAFAAVAGLLALGAGAVAVGATGGSSDPARGDAATPAPTTTTAPESDVLLVDNPAAQPKAGNPAPGPVAPPVEQPPAEQPPTEQPPADQPPAEEPPAEEPDGPVAEPGELAVSTSLIELASNTWTGSFQVRNEGGSALDWSWTPGGAGISVSQISGTLQPGEFVEVSFAVDPTVLPKGDFLFANMVSAGDQVKDVRIEGTKTIAKNPGIELPDPVIKPND